MKTSHIIKLLAGITIATTLCACGGGGGGGGGGSSDPGWNRHPGSTDPKTESDDPNQLLKGRSLELQGAETSYSFTFDESGTCSVTRTNNGSPVQGTLTYTYEALTGGKSANAVFTITYGEEWEGLQGERETLSAEFTFGSATQASCSLKVNNKPVGEVPATFRMLD